MKLMLFTGSWCIPCQQMKPLVKEIAEQYGCNLELVDVEYQADKANQMMVRGVPTLILLGDDGDEVNRASGAMSREQIEEFLSEIY